MLADMPTLTLALWGLATLLTLVLFCRGIAFSQIWEFPFFFLYLLVNLLQTAIGIFLYQRYGFMTTFTFPIAWTTQGIVVIARAMAAAEICYLVLGDYKGIWALASRILGFGGLVVIGLALYFGKSGYAHGIMTLEVGLEAGIATGLVGLFVFARYYQVRVAPVCGQLGLGFGILSCFKIFNDLIVQRFAQATSLSWNYASSGAFLIILLFWVWALRRPVAIRIRKPIMKSAIAYADLMPQVNQRLAHLNEQLTQLWNVESPKP
jgi:hypothetical protein